MSVTSAPAFVPLPILSHHTQWPAPVSGRGGTGERFSQEGPSAKGKQVDDSVPFSNKQQRCRIRLGPTSIRAPLAVATGRQSFGTPQDDALPHPAGCWFSCPVVLAMLVLRLTCHVCGCSTLVALRSRFVVSSSTTRRPSDSRLSGTTLPPEVSDAPGWAGERDKQEK